MLKVNSWHLIPTEKIKKDFNNGKKDKRIKRNMEKIVCVEDYLWL